MRRALTIGLMIVLGGTAAEAQDTADGSPLEARVWLDRGDQPVLERRRPGARRIGFRVRGFGVPPLADPLQLRAGRRRTPMRRGERRKRRPRPLRRHDTRTRRDRPHAQRLLDPGPRADGPSSPRMRAPVRAARPVRGWQHRPGPRYSAGRLLRRHAAQRRAARTHRGRISGRVPPAVPRCQGGGPVWLLRAAHRAPCVLSLRPSSVVAGLLCRPAARHRPGPGRPRRAHARPPRARGQRPAGRARRRPGPLRDRLRRGARL